MKFIAAAFGNDIDLRPRISSVFGRKIRSLKFYFLDKVNSNIVYLAGVAAGIIIHSAINCQEVGNTAVTVYVDRVCRKVGVESVIGGYDRPGNNRQQLIIIPSV